MGLWLIASDCQYPYVNQAAVDVFLAAVNTLQPVGVILAGDILDCRTLSHFTKEPMDPWSLVDEINLTHDLMAHLADIPIKVFEEGNHERCLVNYLHGQAPDLACLPELELPNPLHCEETAWLYLPYGQPFHLGDALVVHGSKVAQPSAATPRKHVEAFHRSVVHGHTRRLGSYWLTTGTGVLQGHKLGCLCSLAPPYMLPPVNWQHGFAAATVAPDGHTIIQLLPIQADGSVILGRERIRR